MTCWTVNGFLWKYFLSKFSFVFLTELKSLTVMASLCSLLRNRLISIPVFYRLWKYHGTMHVSLGKNKHPDTYCYHFGLRSWNTFFFNIWTILRVRPLKGIPINMNLNKFDINDGQLLNKFKLKNRKFQICTYVHM